MPHRSNLQNSASFVVTEPASAETINLFDALLRQKHIVILCTLLGCCLAYLYFQNARSSYQSTARIMVNQRDSSLVQPSGLGSTVSEELVSEDLLANHIELLSSRKNIESALSRADLLRLPSILVELDEDQDVVDYVIEQLKVTRGGRGATKAARSMQLEFTHTNSIDAKEVLGCVVNEYMLLIQRQFQESLAIANKMVISSQETIQTELQKAQQTYVASRINAPVLFTGEGSSNVYVDQFKLLSNQLLDLEIKQSTTRARLQKADAVADTYADESLTMPVEALGVIDTESLQRLGVFANMRANSTRSMDFQKNQPERLEEAKAQYNQLLSLMLEKQRLEADFGTRHPDVEKLQQEIDLVKTFLKDNKVASDTEEDEPQLTSRQLLDAYRGFLKSELVSLDEQKQQVMQRVTTAEQRARSLVDFELQDQLLRSEIDRNQQLFDGLVQQLRTLNIASNVEGYIHEILESPRPGIRIWPRVSILLAAGLMLGLVCGCFAALINDQLGVRFHTAEEMEAALSMPVLGYVGKLPISRTSMLVDKSSTESEAFRMLRTRLLTGFRSGKLSSLMATSASQGAGKSTLLMNIAMSFANAGISVVVVEADMRRPTLRKRLGLECESGVAEVLTGLTPLNECLAGTSVPNLSVIHAGSAIGNPAELLESEQFDTLLKDLQLNFALTIVDVGPVLAVSDSLIVAQKVDGTILITRPSIETRQQVMDAADALISAPVNLLGMIVNTRGSSKQFDRNRQNYMAEYRPLPRTQRVQESPA